MQEFWCRSSMKEGYRFARVLYEKASISGGEMKFDDTR